MGDFIAWLGQFAKDLFPFREVQAWEKGFYVTLNQPGRDVGPGVWPVVPFFQDVRALSVVPGIFFTPLLTVTLKDGKTLSFSAAAETCVTSVRAAILTVDNYEETVREAVTGVVAEEISEVGSEAFESLRARRALMKRILVSVNETVGAYGIEARTLRLTNCAFVRTYRILQDAATGKVW